MNEPENLPIWLSAPQPDRSPTSANLRDLRPCRAPLRFSATPKSDGATVSGSVLLEGAVVEAGALVRDSFVGAGAHVGERTRLIGAVVGDGARVGANNELIEGARVWTDAVLADKSVRFSADA